jgi:hypothetical protein
MTLLAPAALFGLLLLALPVIVHLLRPRKMRQTPFSSLRWLKITRQRLSRRIQWHQWLLFLMRAGLVVVLVLALAKPILGLWNARGPTDRFVIVDAGRAMAYATKEGPTPFERARDIAARLAEQASPGDRTAVVLAGGVPKVLAELTADPGAHLAKLRSASVQLSEDRVTAVLPMLPALLGPAPKRDVELIFVTSNQRNAWQQGEVKALTEAYGDRLSVQVIDVGPGAATNAWIAGARLIERGADEDLVLRVEIGSTGAVTETRSVRLTGIGGLGDDVRDATLLPGKLSRVDFLIPPSVSLAGQVAELRLEPDDALPSDDRWFLNLDMAWSLRLLLVEPPGEAPELPGPGQHLRTALDALAATGNHSFRLATRSSASVTPADVQAADLVILAGVPKLQGEVIAGLEQRVRGGAGLVVYLGGALDAACYRQQLFRPAQPDEGLLPLAFKAGAQGFKQGGPDELRSIRWSHPLLSPLNDPLLGDLGLCKFLRFATFDAGPSPSDSVLARFEDGTPALVERPLGAGQVLFWNTTADDTWSDLPRRRCYVPLVDRTLAYLSAGGVRRQFTVGQPINLPVPAQAADALHVTGPDGTNVPARRVTAGTQTVLHLDGVSRPGIYRVESAGDGNKGFAFAVNTGREASDLMPMDADALASWWSPAAFELVSGDAALARLDSLSSGWSLWPALVLLGGVLLLAETIYVYRLCPHKNPTVVQSVVPQRGILKPMNEPVS